MRVLRVFWRACLLHAWFVRGCSVSHSLSPHLCACTAWPSLRARHDMCAAGVYISTRAVNEPRCVSPEWPELARCEAAATGFCFYACTCMRWRQASEPVLCLPGHPHTICSEPCFWPCASIAHMPARHGSRGRYSSPACIAFTADWQRVRPRCQHQAISLLTGQAAVFVTASERRLLCAACTTDIWDIRPCLQPFATRMQRRMCLSASAAAAHALHNPTPCCQCWWACAACAGGRVWIGCAACCSRTRVLRARLRRGARCH